MVDQANGHYNVVSPEFQSSFIPGWFDLCGQIDQASVRAAALKEREAWAAYDAEFDRIQETGDLDRSKLNSLYFNWVEAKNRWEVQGAFVHGCKNG